MKVFLWWKRSYDKRIVKEVKMSDGLQCFACGNILLLLFFDQWPFVDPLLTLCWPFVATFCCRLQRQQSHIARTEQNQLQGRLYLLDSSFLPFSDQANIIPMAATAKYQDTKQGSKNFFLDLRCSIAVTAMIFQNIWGNLQLIEYKMILKREESGNQSARTSAQVSHKSSLVTSL